MSDSQHSKWKRHGPSFQWALSPWGTRFPPHRMELGRHLWHYNLALHFWVISNQGGFPQYYLMTSWHVYIILWSPATDESRGGIVQKGIFIQGGCHDLECRQSTAHCLDLTHLWAIGRKVLGRVTKPCLQPFEEWWQLWALGGEELHSAILSYKEAVLGVRAIVIHSYAPPGLHLREGGVFASLTNQIVFKKLSLVRRWFYNRRRQIHEILCSRHILCLLW